MTNGFPYWQFHPERWAGGKINFFGFAEQGLFLYLCNQAWLNGGKIEVCPALVAQKTSGGETWVKYAIDAFKSCGILLPLDGDSCHIKFIDEQLFELGQIREKRSRAGKASAEQRQPRKKKRIQEKSREEKSSVLESVQHVPNTSPTCVEHVLNTRFVAPTVLEVQAYCSERKNGIDPELFVSHYERVGWVDNAGNKIKSWKACVVTWEKRDRDRPKSPHAKPVVGVDTTPGMDMKTFKQKPGY